MNIKLHTPTTLRAGSGMSSIKQFTAVESDSTKYQIDEGFNEEWVKNEEIIRQARQKYNP